MTACPICGSDAQIDDRAGGDFIVCDCTRCGRYKLTGSALEMLPDRVESHDRFAARLSHAVRIAWDASHAKDLPVVTSMNLDQLGGRKLPSIDAQIFNLLNWISAQIGDDQMEAGRAAAIAYAREGADVAINYLPDEEADAREVIALIEKAGRKGVALPAIFATRASAKS